MCVVCVDDDDEEEERFCRREQTVRFVLCQGSL